mmetsp:Transcript_24697/g.69321  ORF Transcript_24697/g.69321 Transcript_24697/m.69321 type:complete len:230 (+) Transcript_24697:223-912(+)
MLAAMFSATNRSPGSSLTRPGTSRQSYVNCSASRSIGVRSGCQTLSMRIYRVSSLSLMASCNSDVSNTITFPFSHCWVSSPTDSRHLFSPLQGISNARCDVRTKLVKSVCCLMEDRGSMLAKNTSVTGTPLSRTALAVVENRLALSASQRPRSMRTNVFQPTPYDDASSVSAPAQMLLPSCFNFSISRVTCLNSLRMAGYCFCKYFAQSKSFTSQNGVTLRPGTYEWHS